MKHQGYQLTKDVVSIVDAMLFSFLSLSSKFLTQKMRALGFNILPNIELPFLAIEIGLKQGAKGFDLLTISFIWTLYPEAEEILIRFGVCPAK